MRAGSRTESIVTLGQKTHKNCGKKICNFKIRAEIRQSVYSNSNFMVCEITNSTIVLSQPLISFCIGIIKFLY
jgi:hypothetical protein